MKALTLRQPWAWAVISAGKDIENRNWKTNFRGTVAIHAAKGMRSDEYRGFSDFFRSVRGGNFAGDVPKDYLVRSAIIGVVDIVDCVTESDSPWFFGRYGFVLKNPRTIEPIHCSGALGFWQVPPEIATQIGSQLSSL